MKLVNTGKAYSGPWVFDLDTPFVGLFALRLGRYGFIKGDKNGGSIYFSICMSEQLSNLNPLYSIKMLISFYCPF